MPHRLPLLIIALAWIAYVLGVLLPFAIFDKLIVFSETPSLMQLIAGIAADGDLALAVFVLIFTFVIPILKLGYLSLHVLMPRAVGPKGLDLIGFLSKWSMMDVMLVALAIFAVKTSGLGSAASQMGLWFYAFSAILAAVLSAMIKKRLGNQIDQS